MRWLLIFLAVGCSQTKQVRVTDASRELYLKHDFAGAAQVMMAAKAAGVYGERDSVVYNMNLGMLLREAGEYEQSNEMLLAAATRAADVTSRGPDLADGLAFVTNDTVTTYPGESFERVLIHVVCALNFLALHNLGGAQAEAIKVNALLDQFAKSDGSRPRAFRQDAFARWIAALVLEINKQPREALAAYIQAAQSYRQAYAQFGIKAPAFLGEDIIRVAMDAGDDYAPEIEQAKREFPEADGETHELLNDYGEVILIHANGEAPQKRDYLLHCTAAGCDATLQADGFQKTQPKTKDDTFRLAMPMFIERLPRIASVRMTIEGITAESVPVEPVDKIAVRDLNDRLGRIFVKALARAAAKYAVQKGSQAAGSAAGGDKVGDALDVFTGTVNQATEEADKRSWHTLPYAFGVVRVWLPPGKHDIDLNFVDAKGQSVRREKLQVEIAAGQRMVLGYRTVE